MLSRHAISSILNLYQGACRLNVSDAKSAGMSSKSSYDVIEAWRLFLLSTVGRSPREQATARSVSFCAACLQKLVAGE